MRNHPEICLRYFAARGRAQFLRAYFSARQVPYKDERVPIDEGFASWTAMRDDRSLTGPLQRLPVLHYGDQLIAETSVIAGFVHRGLGDSDALSDDQNLKHDILVSTVNIDLLLPIAMLIWSDVMFAGLNVPAYARRSLERVNKNLAVIDKALDEWNWVTALSTRPITVADCMLWEELDQASMVFGTHFSLDDKPQLARFYREHPAREAFANVLADKPCQITGRPGEPEAIERIQTALADPRPSPYPVSA
jgi:hypothetical protein